MGGPPTYASIERALTNRRAGHKPVRRGLLIDVFATEELPCKYGKVGRCVLGGRQLVGVMDIVRAERG